MTAILECHTELAERKSSWDIEESKNTGNAQSAAYLVAESDVINEEEEGHVTDEASTPRQRAREHSD